MEVIGCEDDYILEELLAMPLEREKEVDWGKPEGEEIGHND